MSLHRLASLLCPFVFFAPALLLKADSPDWLVPSNNFLVDHKQLIQPVLEQWNSSQFGEATPANVLAFYFSKDFDHSLMDQPALPENPIERGDAILQNRFYVLDEYTKVLLGDFGAPDWDWYGPKNDKEWAWMFNRMSFLYELYAAWKATGDEVFLKQLDALWQDWILSCDYPNHLSFSPQWRPLEVARRILGGWISLFYLLQKEPEFKPETRLLVLASILDHADSLKNHASFWGGNHLVTEQNALLAISIAWPEFSSSKAWKESAIERFSNELLSQSYPDGSFKELSNHYQRVILLNASQFVRLLKASNSESGDYPVLKRVEKMWDFFIRVMRPDGFGPLNNAADLEINAEFAESAALSFDRNDWLYIATNASEGAKPDFPAGILFPWAGQAILRSDWSSDAAWLYFDAGPYGSAHQHIDRFHISFFAKNRQILTDNGRYTYQPGKWFQYFKGPRSHNILLLNDVAAEQGPKTVTRPLNIISDFESEYSLVSSSTHFQSSLISFSSSIPWKRTVLFLPEGFAFVFDYLELFSSENVDALWNFHPNVSENETETAVTLISDQPFQRIAMKGQESPEIAGFYSRNYNEIEPAFQVKYHFNLHRPSHLLWLLQAPESPPVDSKAIELNWISSNEVEFSFASTTANYRFRLELSKEPKVLDFLRIPKE